MEPLFFGHTVREVIFVSVISPDIRAEFDSMPAQLQQVILERNVKLETMGDLMACLEQIIAEGEREGK